eukprot:CAMPEP_0203804594 /NCGR_PEP_ID=MMETSP0100_2-20121128/13675_1 /ASSEMBLY_ACC=CAM_ASM_000210 /TAXON_ID=96639 /ORGANISM=" , Strain NY0313808BC1" /LENGTH=250 /DNA_ID=CAMNT_0050712837 /DNA_START=311 /DNA_END=1064 /DNA_ORIENTATION=-
MESLLFNAVALGDVEQIIRIISPQGEEEEKDGECAPHATTKRLGVNLSTEYGPSKTTLLHLACSKGGLRAVMLLLRELGSYEESERAFILNKREDEKVGGRSPLHIAVINGSTHAAVKILLEAGVDPDLKDANGGFSPLHLAIREKRLTIASILVCTGGADINARDKFGNNPAFWFKELGIKDKRVERLLGPPKQATIEERFFAIRRERTAKGLPMEKLPEVALVDALTYKKGAKKKKAGGKKKKGKKKK